MTMKMPFGFYIVQVPQRRKAKADEGSAGRLLIYLLFCKRLYLPTLFPSPSSSSISISIAYPYPHPFSFFNQSQAKINDLSTSTSASKFKSICHYCHCCPLTSPSSQAGLVIVRGPALLRMSWRLQGRARVAHAQSQGDFAARIAEVTFL